MLEGQSMRKYLAIAAALAASVAVTGCATYNPYGYNDPYYNNGLTTSTAGRVATGAAVGAVGRRVSPERSFRA